MNPIFNPNPSKAVILSFRTSVFPYLLLQSTESNFLHLATSIINYGLQVAKEYELDQLIFT